MVISNPFGYAGLFVILDFIWPSSGTISILFPIVHTYLVKNFLFVLIKTRLLIPSVQLRM